MHFTSPEISTRARSMPRVSPAQPRGRVDDEMGGAAAVVRCVPVQTVLLGAAKEATRVSQNLRANERIGFCAHHNGPRLATWGPTDNVSFRVLRGMAVMLGVRFGYPCPT